jgi:large subunit ribosomal protein L17
MEHRKALHRNMAQSLIEHGRVTTTLAKAKDIQPYVEKLITLAVRARKTRSSDPAASLRARRRIDKMLGDRAIIPADHVDSYESMSDAARLRTMRMPSGRRHRTGEPRGRLNFTAESVTHRLIEKIATNFEDREGGYTRLIRLGTVRKGDNAPQAMVQLIGDEDIPTSLTKPPRSARRRRADARYAAAIRASKEFGGSSSEASKPDVEESEATDVGTEVAPEAAAEDSGGDDASEGDAGEGGDEETKDE